MDTNSFENLISLDGQKHCEFLNKLADEDIKIISEDLFALILRNFDKIQSKEKRIYCWQILMSGGIRDGNTEDKLYDIFRKDILKYEYGNNLRLYTKTFQSFWFKDEKSIQSYLELWPTAKVKDCYESNMIRSVANYWDSYITGAESTEITPTFDLKRYSKEIEKKYFIPWRAPVVERLWLGGLIRFCEKDLVGFKQKFDKAFFSPETESKLDINHFKLLNVMLRKEEFPSFFVGVNSLVMEKSLKKIVKTEYIAPAIFGVLEKEAKMKLKKLYNRQKFNDIFAKHATGNDLERKKFWGNYVDSMFDIYYSAHPQNVLVMEFSEIIVFEFLNTANACFFYDKEKIDSPEILERYGKRLAKSFNRLKEISNIHEGDYLKIATALASGRDSVLTEFFKIQDHQNTDGVRLERLSHMPGWEYNFQAALKKYKIVKS